MAIQPVPSVNKPLRSDSIKLSDDVGKSVSKNSNSEPLLDSETKQELDKATGLMQAIISDKISEKVIKKMPSDEYLHLLSLLDHIISGSIDKKV